jgi:hypothetical protein
MANNIDKLFEDTALRPDEILILRDAYTRACKSLHDKGQPAIVNEIIAERIIALAGDGERDPEKLSDGALSALGKRAH